jgi:hypothetical protein
MAIVTHFSPVKKERVGRPTTVDCGFCGVEIDGKRYLVLETYGSTERANPGKASQSLHFDRDGAAQLKALLEKQFPGI